MSKTNLALWYHLSYEINKKKFKSQTKAIEQMLQNFVVGQVAL